MVVELYIATTGSSRSIVHTYPQSTILSLPTLATDTWFRFQVKTVFDRAQPISGKDYEWLKLNCFTRWNASTKKGPIVAFDAKENIRTSLKELVNNAINPVRVQCPYSLHVPFAQLAVHLQNDAVWKIRDAVREVERSRTTHDPQFSRLHDLARHAIHVIETLEVAARTVQSMILHHDRFLDFFATSSTATGNDDNINGITHNTQRRHQIRDQLSFYEEAIQGLCVRSISNRDRLQNEMQFSFNIVAQNIAGSSVETQRAVESDSSVLKTLALATAAFIPLTFVATVFSMSFFHYNVDNDRWNVSDKFWVYWGVAVPFTCVTGFLWYSIHCMSASARSKPR